MKSRKAVILNLYLTIVFLALIISTEWRRRAGSHADYSFLVLLPFLVGMTLRKRWGFVGSMALGILSSGIVVIIALVSIFIQERIVNMLNLGPISLKSPTSLRLIGHRLVANATEGHAIRWVLRTAIRGEPHVSSRDQGRA